MRDAEWNDFFACEVEFFDNGIGRPGGDAPPNWVADDNSAVVGPVGDFGGDEFYVAGCGIRVLTCGAGIVVGPVQIFFGVFLFWFDFENIGAEIFCDFFGDGFGVALRREIDY